MILSGCRLLIPVQLCETIPLAWHDAPVRL